MRRNILSSVVAFALTALNASLGAGPVAAASSVTVVLDGGYAAALPNGTGVVTDHPIIGSNAEHQMGFGAWQAVPTATANTLKFELYIDPTSAPFASLGAFTVADIASISYYTKKTTGATAVDFGLEIYTARDATCAANDASWYCHRLSTEPMYSNNLNAPANQWNQWSTVSGTNQLVFYDSNRTAAGFSPAPTLANLQAGPLNWGAYANSGSTATVAYGTGTVKFIKLQTGTSALNFDGFLDAINIALKNGNSVTVDLEGIASLGFTPPASSVGVGHDVTVDIDLARVQNLYGYQFAVHYDQTKLSASGAFVNSFFDTSNAATALVVWNADCTGTPGTCLFSVTKKNPAVESTGAGTLAQITFHALATGTSSLTIDNDLLSDRNGQPIAHISDAGSITIYGYAMLSGKVNLQGRPTPLDAGNVTLSDAGSIFPPMVAAFDAGTGLWSASVPVTLTGSTYTIVAAHALYLSNRKTGVALVSGNSYPQGVTTLRGGDATNDGSVQLGDLSCIGGAFGGAPTVCGSTGSSDINHDGAVNIYDLTLAGGNYTLSSPQGW